MIGLIQRVSQASVRVADQEVGAIGRGLLVLVGVEANDDEGRARRLAERLVSYRVFPDAEERMNRSLEDVAGELLLVPQFTLVADTRKGTRPSFSSGADPATATRLFESLVAATAASGIRVATGSFGADMQVALVNDGPVTFWLTA